MPRVTVVTPVRDGASTLPGALAGIDRQTYRDWEHVVVDDGSTDDTPDVLAAWRSPRRRVVRLEEPRGVAEALNVALAAATGDLVARLDADDVALPHRLERQVAELDARQSLALLGSTAIAVDAAGRRRGLLTVPVGPGRARWTSLFASPVVTSAAVVRRAAIGDERFDPALAPSEDFDLWCRVLRRGDVDNLLRPLAAYRVHAGQVSRARRREQLEAHEVIVRRSLAETLPDVEVPAELVPQLWRFARRRAFEGDARVLAELLLELHAAFVRRFGERGDVRHDAAAAIAAGARGDRALLDRARMLDPRVRLRAPLRRRVASARALRYRVGRLR